MRTLVHVMTVPECLWRFLGGQIGFMKEHGFDIHAVSSPGEWLEKFAARERVAVHEVPMPRKVTPWKDCVALFRLWRRLQSIHPDIVHSHTPKGGLLGMMAAWLAGVPVRIYTVHGLPLMTAHGLRRLLLRWSDKITCRCANQVYAVSHSIAEVVVQERLCPAAKLKVLLGGSINGVDAAGWFNPHKWGQERRRSARQQYGIPLESMVLGFVGRIVRDKGMVELAAAWRSLRTRFPSLHLLLVGPFEPEDPVPPEVEELFRNDPRIHLAGTVDEASSCYAATDVFVLPTYREGLPGVLLEAAAMKVPVVATRIPGCMDVVVDGVTGTLVPPRDDKALAEAVAAYLLNPALRRQHGLAARQHVLNDFRQEAIWQALHEEYIRLLQEHGLSLPEPQKQTTIPINVQERRAA